MPALRIKLPNSEDRTHFLRGERVTVGRAPDNTIQISHPSISSHHAEFVSVDGRYQLHDLQSTNRSYVEGQPVTEQSLSDSCKILFGSVECEFELTLPVPSKPLELPPSPAAAIGADAAQLEFENCALRARLHALQRHFEILGSARLITGRSDRTPMAAEGDAVKSLSSERDEFRQENVALRLQTDRLREELAVTARERDAARQAAEALQTERAALHADLKKAQARIQRLETELAAAAAEPPTPSAIPAPSGPPPLRPPTSAPGAPPPPPAGAVPRVAAIPAAPPPDASQLPAQVGAFREALARCSANPAEVALHPLRAILADILWNAAPLGAPSFQRITRATQSLLSDLVNSRVTPAAGPLRTLRHAGELLSRLLEPKLLAASRVLATPRVLAIDDDADLLSVVSTALQSAGLEISACASGEEALGLVENERFDTIIADLHLPQMNGAAFCARARELAAYRRTPILFLTVADTLDKRAETSLSGGNEFVAKPFNSFELTLKVECWALKHQLQLS